MKRHFFNPLVWACYWWWNIDFRHNYVNSMYFWKKLVECKISLSLSSHTNIFFKTQKITKLLKKHQNSYLNCKRLLYSNYTPNFILESTFLWPFSRKWTPYGWEVMVKIQGEGAPGAHLFFDITSRIGGPPVGGHQKLDFRVKLGVEPEYDISFFD